MSQPRPFVRLAPITANQTFRNPKILLGGKHQPTLLRYLDGWPRRKGRATAFLIQFVKDGDELAQFHRLRCTHRRIEKSRQRQCRRIAIRIQCQGARRL